MPTAWTARHGNVAFVNLDANDVSYEIPHNLGWTGGRQTAWLADTLAALRADPVVDWIVVGFHHCAYCTNAVHGSDGGVRDAWVALFDQHAVDLVVNGHNHCYERAEPTGAGGRGQVAGGGTWEQPNDDHRLQRRHERSAAGPGHRRPRPAPRRRPRAPGPPAARPGAQVAIDLRDVEFADSSGLGALLVLNQLAEDEGARLVLLDPSPSSARSSTSPARPSCSRSPASTGSAPPAPADRPAAARAA